MFKEERRKWRTTQKLERKKNTKDMDYNNSSRRFRPWGSRVMALSIKCDSLALRTESREEWIFSSGINCMSVWEWLEWERKCSERAVGLDLMLVLSNARLCSLNLSRRRLVSAPGGYSHTVPIQVCAAHVRGRDFEAPDLERGIHFRGVF